MAAGAMAGCSSQPASSASASASASASSAAVASSESASAASESAEAASSAAAEEAGVMPSDAEELKDAIAKVPTFKSVTVEEQTEAAFQAEAAADAADSTASAEASASAEAAEASEASAEASEASAESSEASAEPESITSKSFYKFDESGDKVKTSVESELEGITLKYFTDGDDAVFVTDGPIYSGTTEQFGVSHAAGFKAYLTSTIGDLNTLADCASKVEKLDANGLAVYMVTLDPQKYIASDEVLGIMAEAGDPVTEALFTIAFDNDGSIGAIDLVVTYEQGSVSGKHLILRDYDNTTIDPMPEADRTYEDMEADMKLKLDAFEKQLESEAGAEDAAADAAEADVK